jgi:class 3 adenylate cyclase
MTAVPVEYSGDVTSISVLAIDIVSFSKEFDEKQVRLIDSFNQIVRQSVEELGLRDCILLPTGDGVFAALPGETSAIALRLAIKIHRHIADRLLRLDLRMGIHEGQGLVKDDINGRRNIVGNVANLCQRVMDIGDAGHILLSESANLSLKNSDEFARGIFDLATGPVEVKHGVKLNVFSYYDGAAGNPNTPKRVKDNIGVKIAAIGRPQNWAPFVDTSHHLKIIGNCLRLPASPDFQDALEVAVLSRGTQVRILQLNPLSAAFEARNKSGTYKTKDELKSTFDYLIAELTGFRQKLEFSGGESAKARFDVRLFDAVPTFAGFITDEKAFISLYLENSLGSKGPYFECHRLPGERSLFQSVDSAFDAIWESRSISTFDSSFDVFQEQLLETRLHSVRDLGATIGGSKNELR